jgi:predicted enzyme related to lactoylglutathione lyase
MELGRMEVGIVVADLEVTTPFYRDGLGLRHVGDLTTGLGQMRRFACGDGVVNLQELNEGPIGSSAPGGAPARCTGMRWLTISVDDIEAVFERCEAAGARVVQPVKDFGPEWKLGILEDPEGSCWVELAAPRT